MIKKFLVVGKHVYLQSKAPASHESAGTGVELLLPLEEFWLLEKLVRRSDYLQASGESQGEVRSVVHDIFKISAKYAVSEKDRVWLNSRIKEE